MTKWEQLEEWLFQTRQEGGAFTHADVVEHFGCDGAEASDLIQSYLAAQRANTNNLYVLSRDGRTSAAVWHVGVRTPDALRVGNTYFDDVRVKFVRAVEPDLDAIGAKNPHARRRCERIVEMVADHALAFLQLAVEGIEEDGRR